LVPILPLIKKISKIFVMMNGCNVSVFIWRIFQSDNRANWKVYSTRGENSPGKTRKCHCFFAVSLYEEDVRVRSVILHYRGMRVVRLFALLHKLDKCAQANFMDIKKRKIFMLQNS
jgi:hypothetical protein